MDFHDSTNQEHSSHISLLVEEEKDFSTSIHLELDLPFSLDLDKIVPNGVKSLLCSMCDKPVFCELVCGHRLCEKCETDFNFCPKHREVPAPIDRTTIAYVDYRPVVVPCPNKELGCQCDIRLDELKTHLENCDLSIVTCPRFCKKTLRNKDLTAHVDSGCGFYTEKCPFCSGTWPLDKIPLHMDSCPKNSGTRFARLRQNSCKGNVFLKEIIRDGRYSKRWPLCMARLPCSPLVLFIITIVFVIYICFFIYMMTL